MKEVNKKCYWCGKKAETIDYRTINDITSKIISCFKCFNKPTKILLRELKGGLK